jgi:glycyl-tRNA synthetase beta chain
VRERFRNLMIAEGFPQDVVDAVISAGFGDIVETKRKIEALAEFRNAPDFEALGIAFKRVVNIVKGQEGGEVKEPLFAEPVEKELFSSLVSARRGAGEKISKRDYKGALDVMKGLKEPVDRFFDNVMVMDKNEDLKRNRLSMLREIRELFFTIADFSKLST